MNQPPPLPPGAKVPPRTGLSTTSLVLGLLSFVGCVMFTAIPAIITGHIARRRAKREPEIYGGRGMALAGLILGYGGIALILIVGIAAAIVVPNIAKRQGFGPMRPPSVCVSQLKQISLAAHSWANEHNDVFPPDFLTLSNELTSPRILACPQDPFKTAVANWSEFKPADNLTYEFLLPGAKVTEVSNQEVFRCPNHGHVARGDGSVEEVRRRQ